MKCLIPFPLLVAVLPVFFSPPVSAAELESEPVDPRILQLIEKGISDQRNAGHEDYDPRFAYVVDPSRQRLSVVDWRARKVRAIFPAGTGKRGLGDGGSQTPVGFFTMGGVRIAKNASAYVQTGDSKKGVSGVYAEMLYPPSHSEPKLRGRVPNNVIIHGYNPTVSRMLRERHRQKLIGKEPCTTGCPVLEQKDLPLLASFLRESAGPFDAGARPNSNLRRLISTRQVTQYSRKDGLGDPILILDRPFRN